ncbi:MAG: hypothetical protein AAFW75_07490 [Cyanobacteria bacterium J06636_16]
MGRQITDADRITHQLYTGHRGAGKSTELLRLEADLTEKGYRVVYFPAEEADIDPEDAQYTDILHSTHPARKRTQQPRTDLY